MEKSSSDAANAVIKYFTQDSVGDVQLGELGLQRSQNAAVRSLAAAMVGDHTATAREGLAVGKTLGDAPEFKPGDDNTIALAHLLKYSGAEFDREYVKTLIDAHRVDLSTIKDAMEFTGNASLRKYLDKSASIDRKHLQMALSAQARL